MSKFYGTVHGDMSQTDGTRRGSRSIKVAAQSWDGSLITSMHYGHDDALMVDLSTSDDSSTYGHSIFYGTLDELKARLRDTEPDVTREMYEDRLMTASDVLNCSLALFESGAIDGAELYARMCKLNKVFAGEEVYA